MLILLISPYIHVQNTLLSEMNQQCACRFRGTCTLLCWGRLTAAWISIAVHSLSVVKDNSLKLDKHSSRLKRELGGINASCLSATKKEGDGFNTGDCNAKLHTKKNLRIILMMQNISCMREWQTQWLCTKTTQTHKNQACSHIARGSHTHTHTLGV